MTAEPESPDFEALLDYLKESRNFDFKAYKRSSLRRRVERRMNLIGVSDYAVYSEYLSQVPEEFDHLFNTVLINVTTFFRDGIPWEFMADEVIPGLLEKKEAGEAIRVWSAGCATGEEAFTMAMVLCEALGTAAFKANVKVYATDVDDEALLAARRGAFSLKDVVSVPEALRVKYFEKADSRFYFRKDLRRCIIFGRHDLLQDAPISRVDILVCRNTLMYFNTAAQARILARFHFALNEGGYLFLGRAETLLAHATTFRPVDLKRRVFAKIASARLTSQLRLVPEASASIQIATSPPVDEMRDGAFDASGIAQLIVDREGTLVLANQAARSMFGILLRDIGRPFHDLEVSYRPIELRSLIEQAHGEQRAIALPGVEMPASATESRWLDVRVVPLPSMKQETRGASITFADVTTGKHLQQALELTNVQLQAAYEQLQSTNEELETTNEELQSTVEELETTNEELQATNEELETMNEEVQSTNEELQTVNDLARVYAGDLDTANDFLESIFTGLGHRVIVLDSEMRVILWNKGAEELWGVRADDVTNTSFLELDIGLPVAALREAIDASISGRSNGDKLMIRATDRRGRVIDCRVTIASLPSASGSGIDGVIMLIDDRPANAAGKPGKLSLMPK